MNFKVFGIVGATILFLFIQLPYLAKNRLDQGYIDAQNDKTTNMSANQSKAEEIELKEDKKRSNLDDSKHK